LLTNETPVSPQPFSLNKSYHLSETINQERERSRREEIRPRLELPLERYPAPRRPAGQTPGVVDDDDANRGVIILDIV